jgi:alpha-tubulin suppressor-like RCC1 family protein
LPIKKSHDITATMTTNCQLTARLFFLCLFSVAWPLQSQAQPASGGVVFGWGEDYAGESSAPADATNIVAISAGYNHSLGLKADGTVDAWGLDELGATAVPAGLSNVIAVAAGDNHSLALESNGTVVAWGYDGYGQTNVPAGLSNVVAIAAGDFFSLALLSNGSVAAWGDNANSQVLEASYAQGIKAIAANAYNVNYAMGLRTDGTVVEWGLYIPPIPSNATNVVQIACGGAHYMALKADGTVVAWGDNTYGQTNVPAGLSNVMAIAAGGLNSMALERDGTVVVWGDNSYGEGITPYGLTNVTAISAGGRGFNLIINNGSPLLTAWPTNQYVYTGMPVTFYSAPPASPVPFYFQWQVDGTNIPGASANSFNLTAAQLTDGGAYSLIVTNIYGSLTSTASLTVVSSAPIITQQPSNQTVTATSNATFSVSVVGSWPLSYQWQSNSMDIPGATNATLVISSARLNQSGTIYDAVVTNAVGMTVSSNAILNVVPEIVAIQPQNLSTNGNATVTFTSAVTGAGPFAYQWQFNGTNLPNQTNSTLSLTGVVDTQSGAYDLIVSNSFGTVVSSNGMLTVVPWISISISPSTENYGSGILEIIAFNVGGLSQPLNYSWTLNGNPFGGPNPGGALEGFNLPMSYAGTYTVTASDPYFTLSTNATLTIIPLTITGQVQNAYAWVGGSTKFAVSAIGVPSLGYQWQFNGTNLSAPNTNFLFLTNVAPSQFGSYNVIVSNAWTNITSSSVTLLPSQVAVWGGSLGESNLTAGLTNIVAISSSGYSNPDCQALTASGTIITWPASYSPFLTQAATNLISIAGASPGIGLNTNGRVGQWPADTVYYLAGLSNIVAISGFDINSASVSYLALKNNGLVFNPALIPGLSNIVAVAAGASGYIALTAAGTVTSPYFAIPPTLTNVVAVAAGYSHALVLQGNGKVTGLGANTYGQITIPSNATNVVAIAAGSYHSLALRADGTVVAWGNNSNGQTNVPPGLTNVIAIAAGTYESMALIGNGPPVTSVYLSAPGFKTNAFNISLPSQNGRVYVLQYKKSFSDTNWTSLPLVPGDGHSLNLTDLSATNSQRFYRVQRW